MAIKKNVASQKLAVYAYDPTTAAGTDPSKTGDAANITAQISLDGGTSAATNDVSPTELDATDHPGVYIFDLTQAETNAEMILLSAVSSTSNILLDPIQVLTSSNADDVWDAQQSMHNDIGTLGAYVGFILGDTAELQADWVDGGRLDLLVDAIKAKTDDLTFTVANQVDANALTGGGAIGPGSVSQEFTIQAAGVPVAGVEAWVSTDSAGSNVVAGTLVSDDFGVVTFLLDPGTYYLWRDSTVHNFPNPVSFTVI